MGMLIRGVWVDNEDRFMRDGVFERELNPLTSSFTEDIESAFITDPSRFVLVASLSCPWSHAVVLTRLFAGLNDNLALQIAGEPRDQGYRLSTDGPLTTDKDLIYVHQLYSKSNEDYTGRATVPVFWDTKKQRIISNSSEDIMMFFNAASKNSDLNPAALRTQIDLTIKKNFDGLSNAVYRAGLAQTQPAYDDAVNTVFSSMERLDKHLKDESYLVEGQFTLADIRLFATLVRFDTVYATHFRCTRKRLVDYSHLWRYARKIYQLPGVANTVDFKAIQIGYFLNDGDHNPHGIISALPEVDWSESTDIV